LYTKCWQQFKPNRGGLVGGTRTELQRLFERRIGGVIGELSIPNYHCGLYNSHFMLEEFRSEWEARCTELCSEWVQVS
jgi:hypothetical protein